MFLFPSNSIKTEDSESNEDSASLQSHEEEVSEDSESLQIHEEEGLQSHGLQSHEEEVKPPNQKKAPRLFLSHLSEKDRVLEICEAKNEKNIPRIKIIFG